MECIAQISKAIEYIQLQEGFEHPLEYQIEKVKQTLAILFTKQNRKIE